MCKSFKYNPHAAAFQVLSLELSVMILSDKQRGEGFSLSKYKWLNLINRINLYGLYWSFYNYLTWNITLSHTCNEHFITMALLPSQLHSMAPPIVLQTQEPQARYSFKVDSLSTWVASAGVETWPTEGEDGVTNNKVPASRPKDEWWISGVIKESFNFTKADRKQLDTIYVSKKK